MKKIKKLLSFLVIAVLSLGASFSLFGCKNVESFNKLNENSLKITPNNSEINIAMLCSEVITTGNETYLRKSLEATITNGDAIITDDCVWSVYWGEDGYEEDVAEYIKVEPESGASNRVFVYCYKTFYDRTIVIEVKANTTGKTAICICEYVGIPDSVYVEVNDKLYNHLLEMPIEVGTYTFDLSLGNALGPVDISSANFELGEIYGNGQFAATTNTVGGDNNVISTDITIDMNTNWGQFISASIEGNVLTVQVFRTVNTYYVQGNRGWVEFKDYLYPATMAGKPMPCTVNIPLKETTMDVDMLIVLSPLSNVTLSNYNLTF